MTKKAIIKSTEVTQPKNEVAVKKDSSVESLISQAISNNVPVEVMERLFGLREKMKAEQAKEEYVRAISAFQNACPIIEKTKKVLQKDGRTVRYMYAPLDSIVEQIKKPLTDNGLSYRWETKNEEGNIKAICVITHTLGHSESSEFAVPIDTEGYMTAPQKYASALTFAKRYTLCNALGISTGDEDTDATDVGKESEAKSDKAKIMFLLKSLGEKTSSKEEIEKAVKRITNLSVTDKNLEEIVSRLEISVKEAQEYENSKVQ